MTPPRDRDGMTDDTLETRLRRALNTEASMVNPSGDGLGRIRAGIAEEQSTIWWRRPALALVAAAVIGLAVGGVAVAIGQNDDNPNDGIAGQPDDEKTTAPATTAPAPTSSPSNTNAGGSTVSVPVYYVMDDGQAIRLFREFHKVPALPEGKIATAVEQMFGDKAIDPDYSSSWSAGTEVLSVSKSGDTATVDLSSFPSVGADAETKAVQQLVYTVTATDNTVKKVRLLVDGTAPQSGHSDWSQPVTRAPMLEVQGLIWILTPTQGSQTGSPVKVSVYGTAFEGNVSLQVYQGDTMVTQTFVTTAMGMFLEASTTIKLEPGSYELRAFESSAKDGTPQHVDTKTFTVK
jgi:hypothetical protein